jgi:hypothetical protein
LIEAAHPSRSGLVAASSAELGLDESGVWRRGVRGQLAREGQVTVLRRADDARPRGWPVLTAGAAHAAPRPDAGPVSCPLVAVDLGLVPLDAVASLGHPRSRVVIACRTTIPGVRLTEQLLASLGDAHLVVGMLGPRRWPGEVTCSAGPRLRALRDHDRVVPVPRDRHLEVTGPTYAALPRAVLAAGCELLRVLEADQYSARGGRA